jgi:AbiU2
VIHFAKTMPGEKMLGGIIKGGSEMASETERKVKNQQEEFENVFEILRKQLLAASVDLYIWEQLWPSEKVVDIINQYKGFFLPTRAAHVDGLILKVSDILSHDSNVASFYRIFHMLEINSNLAPDINVREMKKSLRKHKEVLEAIKSYRNKRVAHWDTRVEKLEKQMLLGPTKEMLKELDGIYNKISASHSGGEYVFRYVEQGDTNNLLEALRKKEALDRRLIEYLMRRKRCRKMILSLMMNVR